MLDLAYCLMAPRPSERSAKGKVRIKHKKTIQNNTLDGVGVHSIRFFFESHAACEQYFKFFAWSKVFDGSFWSWVVRLHCRAHAW